MQKKKNSWSRLLESNGFKWDESNEYYKKGLGFGRYIIVDHIVRGLFKVTNGDTVIHNNFINSFDEFKKIIKKALAAN